MDDLLNPPFEVKVSRTGATAGQVPVLQAGGGLAFGTISGGGGSGKLTGSRIFNIRDYGAKQDAIRITDAAITAGATALTSSSYTFTSADVGKTIGVEGAGTTTDALNTVLQTTISAVSGGQATLAASATTTVSAARATFGTPDDAAFLAAQNAAATTFLTGESGGIVYIPAGRSVVTQQLSRVSYVSYRGEGRTLSLIAPITASGSWMISSSTGPATPLIGIDDAHFGIEAGNMNAGASYSSSTKPYNMHHMKQSSAMNLAIWDSPATAIPFDASQDQCTIAFNYIYNPGRTAAAGGKPGGSGIGVGLAGTSDVEQTLILGNVIVGVGTTTTPSNGNNGIFTESQAGTASTMSSGIRIIGNYVKGMRWGILDAGGIGTVIQGNICEGNATAQIGVAGGTIPSGMPGLDTLITGNVCRGGTSTGSGGHGIWIDGADTSHTNETLLRCKVSNNQILNNNGYGILYNIYTIDSYGVDVMDNYIRGNGLTGMNVAYDTGTSKTAYNLRISGNTFVNNGASGTSNDTYGLRVAVKTSGAEVFANRFYDDQTTKTQTIGFRVVTQVQTGISIRQNNFTGVATSLAFSTTGLLDSTSSVSENVGYTGGGPTAVTVSASPFTYTAGNTPEDIYIDGGTVTTITKASTTIATASNRMVRLGPGQALTITYTAAPTVVADKR